MPPVDRKNPKRAASSDSRYSLMEFMREFPDDDACLEYLWRARFAADGKTADCPKCEREQVEFKKYATKQRRQTWTCTACGHHVQPTAGTIFEGSSTSLHLWFYAIHLMTSTRCGLSAKQLEREIGVTYKTAWRMLNLIRDKLMAQDGEPLSGEVEADETAWGGKPRQGEVEKYRREGETDLSGAGGRWKQEKKKTVFAMVERGGRVRAAVVPSRGRTALHGEIVQYVLPGSTVFTDDWYPYVGLDGRGYVHHRIRHSEKVYVSGDVHTQTIEGFFSNLKRGIGGTYHAVSTKWLPSYLNEYAWRYNHRHDDQFRALLLRAAAPA
jgi:transposase-like protein